MTRYLYSLVFLVIGTAAISGCACGLSLAVNGKTDYKIVLKQNPSVTDKTAALELQKHLKSVTGAQFPIKNETQVKPEASQILVGRSKRVEYILGGIDWNSLGSDGILIKTKGKSLVLAGGEPRGTIYAVYSFLEDTVGCRWWTPTESYLPAKKSLSVPSLDYKYTPSIKCREASYRNPNRDGIFASRLKLNGHWYATPPEYGGHYSILGWCHTFYELLLPTKYFAAHPEWYSLVNGKRVNEGAQLCLSNSEMRAELVRNALEKIKENPAAGIISISQNDANGQCECADCQAIVKKEGSPSGPIIEFVNAVAEEIEKQYPDFLVETLAYTYSRKAPLSVKPRRNVLIRLCSIEGDFAQPLESDANASFRNDVNEWSKIASNLYIWNYVTNFRDYIMPHPNMDSFGADVRFFEKNNVVGIFQQGDAANAVGEFGKMRAWVLAHLMWNPALDQKKLTNEFMKGYYGAAAPYLKSYLELVQSSFMKTKRNLSCYNRDFSFLGIDEMNECNRLFDEAEDAVKSDAAIYKRVRAERLPLAHAWLLRYSILKRLAKDNSIDFTGPADPVAACEQFIADCKEFGNIYISEGQSLETYEPKLRKLCAAPPPPPEEFKNLSSGDYADIQDSLFTYYWSGEYSFYSDDASASDGKTAKSPGGHNMWSLQWPVTPDFTGKWRCYVVARCESKLDKGNAFDIGIWDQTNSQGIEKITVTLEEDANKPYKAYDLGVRDLNTGMYFYFVPNGDGSTFDAFYIDRIFLVKEP